MHSCTTIIHTARFGQHAYAATPYGCSNIYRTVFTLFSCSCEPATTVRDLYFNYRTGFFTYDIFGTWLRTVRFVTDHRTALLLQIPYGFSVATWVVHIAKYRTGLFFPPYGIISLRPFRTTLEPCTVRVSKSHRTVCSFSGFLMMYLPTSRPYYKTKSS